jgi:hypothetical protein
LAEVQSDIVALSPGKPQIIALAKLDSVSLPLTATLSPGLADEEVDMPAESV